MTEKGLPVRGNISFEGMKQINEHGAEYWSARDLQPLLGYSQWRRFEEAIKRAMVSCQKSGNPPDYHFAGAGKMIGMGKTQTGSGPQRINNAGGGRWIRSRSSVKNRLSAPYC